MLHKMIAIVLVAVLLDSSLTAQTQPRSPVQTPATMQLVLRKAQEKDKAVKIKLARKIDDQTKLSGKVSEISDAGFTLTDQKTGATKKLAYEDVQQVSQKGLSKGSKVAIGIAMGAGALIAVGLVVCYANGQCRD